ncbi:sharpin isoform X4 [Pelodiscus sinensis]|uniref:sharpin isoform X4 n=1 Tax=Pelodiscus sinensis TaxID=13735 RepID=UPI003F6C4113
MAPPTVLMSVRAWAARPLRLLPPAGASPAGDALLRLQLSVRPGPGPGPPLFRLALRHTDARRSQSVAEYDLKDVTYTVQSALCHELALRRGEEDPLLLHFEDEREAHEWWTVLSSSLREAQKAAESPGELVPPPALLPAASGSAPTTPAPDTPQPAELSHREDLALRLARAIEFGDEQAASQCAVALAQQQASLRILLPESSYPADEIRMKVGVEDATCSTNITIRVHAHMPLRTLRQQVFREYGFHPSVQRWIIGQCLCADDRTLGSYGIRRDGDTAFLYLLSATRAGLSEQRCEEDHALATLPPAPSLADGAGAEETRRSSALPSMAPKRAWLPGTGGKMDIGEISQHLGMLQLCSTAPSQPKAAPPNAAPPAPAQAGWPCPTCTFINKPTRPGCEMCSTARPAAYVVPGSHRPDTSELWRMQQEEEGIVQYQQALAVERRQNFQRLLQLEEEGLVPSPEAMDCPICCLPVARGEGVLLRECLHSFCSWCRRRSTGSSWTGAWWRPRAGRRTATTAARPTAGAGVSARTRPPRSPAPSAGATTACSARPATRGRAASSTRPTCSSRLRTRLRPGRPRTCCRGWCRRARPCPAPCAGSRCRRQPAATGSAAPCARRRSAG